MIDKSKFNIDWIEKNSYKNHKADKILIEKVIRALLLVEGLVKQKLNFVFKGGSALMLIMNSTKRFSIDIDIIISETIENIDNIFNDLLNEQGFTRFELQTRKHKSKINKSHYKFFYAPIHKTKSEEDYILLDILFEQINYNNIKSVPLDSEFTPNYGTPLIVDIPSFEDFLGDKLTAFAPETTGIPYFKKDVSMSMEIIKQLYDIGYLFDLAEDMNIIKSTFFKFIKTELSYCEKDFLSGQDVLNDIFQTSLCISSRGTEGNGDFKQLQLGIQRIKNFIFSENYQIEKAIIHSSKSAYLSSLIKYNADRIEKFNDPLQLKDWIIKEPLTNKLNRLKKSNPEAFFYWYKIFKLMTKEN